MILIITNNICIFYAFKEQVKFDNKYIMNLIFHKSFNLSTVMVVKKAYYIMSFNVQQQQNMMIQSVHIFNGHLFFSTSK